MVKVLKLPDWWQVSNEVIKMSGVSCPGTADQHRGRDVVRSSYLSGVQFLEEARKVPQVRYGPLEMRQRRRSCWRRCCCCCAGQRWGCRQGKL